MKNGTTTSPNMINSPFIPCFPLVGLGTYQLTSIEGQRIFEKAYELGYRHFDTATFYENERNLQIALSSHPRESYLLTSKLWPDDMGYYGALKAFDRSLNELGTHYLDNYLIHWPDPKSKILDTLVAFQELLDQNKIRYMGVSNFTIKHLDWIYEEGFKVSFNEVEYHVYLNQQKLLEYCKSRKIQLIAYCPLAREKLLKEPLLVQIGKKYQKSSAQIALRWLIQKEILVIPMATTSKHLKENIEIFDFQLDQTEMKFIDGLNKNERIVDPDCGDF